MLSPDFLIIGAGVIGCSLARELARVSKSVVVLDRGRAGDGASSAAAGLLTPTVSRSEAGALADLCFDSAALYEGWVNELRADGSGDVGFRRSGLLDVWTTADQAEHGIQSLPDHARPNRRVEHLSAAEVRRREPAVGGPVEGGAFYPDDALVDAERLSREVARVAEVAGVTVRESEPVWRLVRDGDRVTAVETPAETYHPGLVVVAAGAWSGGLLTPLGVELAVRPVKGQMLLADCRVPPVRGPFFAGEALFVPQADGRLLLGVTVEEAGFDERVTADGLRHILTNTCAVVPAVGGLTVARAWAGLRPATPDCWPHMGPVPPLHNLWVSTGHFRKGILLAPLCARLVAQAILAGHAGDELAGFKPTRRAG